MKKAFLGIIAIFSVLILTFASCEDDSDSPIVPHEHIFATTYTTNETHHWYAATCEHSDEVKDKAEHDFGEWETTKVAKEETDGSKKRECKTCHYVATEIISALEHKHKIATEWTYDEDYHWHIADCGREEHNEGKTAHTWNDCDVTKPATETEDGEQALSCECGATSKKVIPALGHNHEIAKTYTSNETHHWYAASCDREEHNEGKIAHSWNDGEITKQPTCSETGIKTYACNICRYVKNEDIAPLGFVKVPAGKFTGSSTNTVFEYTGVFSAERIIDVKPFYMSDHEVTQKEYAQYGIYGTNKPSETYGIGDNYPAYNVNWYDTIVYCNKRSIAENLTPCYKISDSTNPNDWGTIPTKSNSTWDSVICDFDANGYRLPTEIEWEYAARGGNPETDTWKYEYAGADSFELSIPISDNALDNVGWYKSNSDSKTHEVKTKEANSLGLYDMSGNVFEFCWDSYGDGEISSSTSLLGAPSGYKRVRRGGSWRYDANCCVVSYRYYHSAGDRGLSVGFRVVRSIRNVQ